MDIQTIEHQATSVPAISPFTTEDVEGSMDLPEELDGRYRLDEVALVGILNDIANCGVAYRACQNNGITLNTYIVRRRKSPRMKELHEQAMEIYRERISLAVHSRSIEGWLEPIMYNGECVGYKRVYSDRLLQLHAKRHIADYSERHEVNVTGTVGVLVAGGMAESEEEFERLHPNIRKIDESPKAIERSPLESSS